MRYRYTQWDGTEFQSQEHLRFFDGMLDLLLAYGDRALDALRDLELDEDQRRMLEQLAEQGLLEKAGVRWRLTPSAVHRMQRRALMEVFSGLRPGGSEGHEIVHPGSRGDRSDGTKPYEYGDPASEIDLAATLRNAVARGRPGLPIGLDERDFELHRCETQTDCHTVILLDLSGSMYRYGRFVHAKKCAMAMHALIRQRFPRDTIEIVGFSSTAAVIPEMKLPLVMPRRVTLFDSQVRRRMPLAQADKAPQHFTNLHMGLVQARRMLRRGGSVNRQIFIITDGEPTAHVEGDFLYLIYPPDERTAVATLTEAFAASRDGTRLATFALIDDYAFMDWVGFVDRLTRLTRGVAFYCHGGDLSSCIMESYLAGKRRKAYLA
jgi:Ca-activated chloride channel family protein